MSASPGAVPSSACSFQEARHSFVHRGFFGNGV